MPCSLEDRRERDRMRKRLRRFLDRGGVLQREDIQGAVGVRWARATRSGPSFPTPLCERWVGLGKLAPIDAARNLFGRSPATHAQDA